MSVLVPEFMPRMVAVAAAVRADNVKICDRSGVLSAPHSVIHLGAEVCERTVLWWDHKLSASSPG